MVHALNFFCELMSQRISLEFSTFGLNLFKIAVFKLEEHCKHKLVKRSIYAGFTKYLCKPNKRRKLTRLLICEKVWN